MAINFPSSPSNGATHTDAGTTWVFSSADNSWTITSATATGISNGTDYDNSLVVLDNVGGSPTKNLPIAAQGLEFNPTDKRLTIKMVASPSVKPFAILDSNGAELNAFNVRGILDKAGRIYYAASAPTVNSADTGQLWYDTTNSILKVSNTSAAFDTVVNTASFVTLATAQTLSAIKTFSAVPVFSAGINVSGGNIALNSGCNIATGGLAYNILGNPTMNGTVSFSGAPTFSGNPVVSGNLTFTGATSARLTGNCEDLRIDPTSGTISRIICSTSETSTASSNNLQLSPNKSASGRKLVIYENGSADSTGILINPKNGNNVGNLTVSGNTTINGNLTVSGGTLTIPANSYIPGLSTMGSFRNQTADATYNPTTLPTPIGPLTFAGGVYNSTGNTVTLDITNTSTAPVSFYFRRETNTATTQRFLVQKVTMAASTTWNISNIYIVGSTTPQTGVTSTFMASDASSYGPTSSMSDSTKVALFLTITLI